jgi:hypothetical protein
MTDIFQLIVAKLQDKHQDDYTRLMASKQFTVSFELPENEDKLSLNIFYNDKKNIIKFPLSDKTSKSLKDSLTTVTSQTKASATLINSTYLPTSTQQGLLLKSTPLIPTKPRITTPYLPTTDQQNLLLSTREKGIDNSRQASATKSRTTNVSLTKTPTIQQNQAPSEQKPQTAEATIVYRFFAAIFNYFLSFFYDTAEEPKTTVNTSLVTNGQSQAAQRSTSGSTGQTKTTGTEKVIPAIRGLRNGNNICFINAIFQALVNMPEIIPFLIDAHNKKIKKENLAINELELQCALDESKYLLPWSSSPQRIQLKALEESKEASITLNQALRTYHTTKDIVWLDALRGFDPNFSGSSEEDASELLNKIFDPLLEHLRGGLNNDGRPSQNIIPDNIDPVLKTSLSRFVHKFGTRVQWVLENAEVDRNLKNITQLPPNGIREEVGINSTLLFPMPNERTTLQNLVTAQLQMQDVPVEVAVNNVFEINGVKGNYRASQQGLVIKPLEGNAPEYVPLQLLRFNDDLSKNETEIVLPENNRITLVVDGLNVNYEIQTLVMHSGATMSRGHYFSYVRKNGAWTEVNDRHVSDPLAKLPKETVEKEVYMVFLKKVH